MRRGDRSDPGSLSLWDSRETAERHTQARLAFRDRITATVDVEVQETVGYEVGFARLTGLQGEV